MDAPFWLERWQREEIGFHQDSINTHLQLFWHQLGVAPGKRIFVPLCGKSRDMLWLASQGYEVLGVEISPIAVEAFFAENGLTPQRGPAGRFEQWQKDEVTLLMGDFFDLAAGDLAGTGGVYDRASLIALPPPMRERYAAHLSALLAPGTAALLVTMEYPQGEMGGPPFCVLEEEVRTLYDPTFHVTRIHSEDILDANPRFRQRGLTRLWEHVFVLIRRGAG